jgi:hypothetical protein
VPSLVKIHWRMLILDCPQGCYTVKKIPSDLDLWPWKSIGHGHRVKFLPHNILVNTLESRSFNGFWPNLIHTYSLGESGTLLIFKVKGQGVTFFVKINRVPDSPKDYVCTKFGQNPLKDIDSRVFTRMICGKNLTRWPWPLTYDLEGQIFTA